MTRRSARSPILAARERRSRRRPTSMTKTVLTFGLIGGVIAAALMLVTVPFQHSIAENLALVIGYTTIVLASLMVFFGVRSYRETVGDGHLTFGRGFVVGLLITLITCLCYVGTWEIVYFKLMPDFGARFAAQIVENVRASGADQAKIDEATRQAHDIKAMLDDPLKNSAMTFLEPFPVGLAIALISAVILRRK
jgi:uncharacterized protein DUF4199